MDYSLDSFDLNTTLPILVDTERDWCNCEGITEHTIRSTMKIACLLLSMLAFSVASNAAAPALYLPRGGGWLDNVSKEVDGSVASATKLAKEAYESASAKAADAAKDAKAKADQAWIQKLEKLENRILEERNKASERLASQQKRLLEQAEKEKRRLQAKIDDLQKKLNDESKK